MNQKKAEPTVRILSTAEIFAPLTPEESAIADEDERVHEMTGTWPAIERHRAPDVDPLLVSKPRR